MRQNRLPVKNMIRRGIIFLITAAVLSVLACGKGQTTTKDGKTILRLATWEYALSPYQVEMVSAFEAAYPNVKVEVSDIPAVDYTQKLSVMLNGGSEVDVFLIKDGDTIKGLSNRGQLADLAEYIQRDHIDRSVFNGMAERFDLDGKTVALPITTAYYVLFYNKTLFDKAGISYPSNDMTWTEFEALAGRMSSGSGKDKIYGAHFHVWPACVQNWAVQDGKHTIVDTNYSFMKPYYEMAVRMQNAGIVMDYGSLKAGNINYANVFLNGNIAMLPMGYWFAGTIKTKVDHGEASIEWGVAALPHPESVPAGWTVGSVTPIAINQASKNKDLAWEYLKFATSEEGAMIYARAALFPGRLNTATLQEIVNVPGMPGGLLEALEVKHIEIDRPIADHVAEINQMLTEEHGLIMLKEVGIDKGIENMNKRSREIQGN